MSLFAVLDNPGPAEVIDAVRAAGKQGELGAAVFEVAELRRLGLVLRRTEGGTPDPAVNAIHFEAGLPWWRTWLFKLTGRSIHDGFNERFSERLNELARVLE